MADWQPIETAPLESVLLLYGADAEGFPMWEVKDIDEFRTPELRKQQGFTHWIHLPESPHD